MDNPQRNSLKNSVQRLNGNGLLKKLKIQSSPQVVLTHERTKVRGLYSEMLLKPSFQLGVQPLYKYSERKGTKRQPYQHFTRCPATGIYVYSFALNPEQHQPSGSVNMSRIDNATLLLDLTTGTSSIQLRVYAVNYNVLRIMAGINLHLYQTVSCIISSANTYYEKQCKLAGYNFYILASVLINNCLGSHLL